MTIYKGGKGSIKCEIDLFYILKHFVACVVKWQQNKASKETYSSIYWTVQIRHQNQWEINKKLIGLPP